MPDNDHSYQMFEVLARARVQLPDSWDLVIYPHAIEGGATTGFRFRPEAGALFRQDDDSTPQEHADSLVVLLCDQLISDCQAVRDKVTERYRSEPPL